MDVSIRIYFDALLAFLSPFTTDMRVRNIGRRDRLSINCDQGGERAFIYAAEASFANYQRRNNREIVSHNYYTGH